MATQELKPSADPCPHLTNADAAGDGDDEVSNKQRLFTTNKHELMKELGDCFDGIKTSNLTEVRVLVDHFSAARFAVCLNLMPRLKLTLDSDTYKTLYEAIRYKVAMKYLNPGVNPAGGGTCIFGYVDNTQHLAMLFGERRAGDIALAKVHFLGNNRDWAVGISGWAFLAHMLLPSIILNARIHQGVWTPSVLRRAAVQAVAIVNQRLGPDMLNRWEHAIQPEILSASIVFTSLRCSFKFEVEKSAAGLVPSFGPNQTGACVIGSGSRPMLDQFCALSGERLILRVCLGYLYTCMVDRHCGNGLDGIIFYAGPPNAFQDFCQEVEAVVRRHFMHHFFIFVVSRSEIHMLRGGRSLDEKFEDSIAAYDVCDEELELLRDEPMALVAQKMSALSSRL